jgi:carbon-monoxide dehydrogenase small subunit
MSDRQPNGIALSPSDTEIETGSFSDCGAVTVTVTVTVNGQLHRTHVQPRIHLADFLRDMLGLTGTHLGCEQGACGSCTVLVDGRSTRACLMPIVQADGCRVETVEGLAAPNDPLSALQQSFARNDALQCGFCTPGFLMAATELLQQPILSEHDIRDALSGNLCRCTGYQGIIEAVAEQHQRSPGSGVHERWNYQPPPWRPWEPWSAIRPSPPEGTDAEPGEDPTFRAGQPESDAQPDSSRLSASGGATADCRWVAAPGMPVSTRAAIPLRPIVVPLVAAVLTAAGAAGAVTLFRRRRHPLVAPMGDRCQKGKPSRL